MDGDKGLVLKDKAAHHAISAKFDTPITNTDDTLVVQYEVKPQSGLECGGAYMKLLQDSAALHAEEFSNASPYIIMFGPDKCGATNKVHFIFRHKNPKTGEYEEKHLKSPPAARVTKTTTLYTLIVKPDQTYEIRIDGEAVKGGSLLEDFTPAVNPEKEIDDPEDKKPEDWVEEAKISDPDAKKPADWDEDAPYEVVDEEAEKPADWLEDEPASIPDPEAEKPEDWDDEEDGDWIPPTIPNPKGDEVSGLGPWEKPMKPNPEYKGKWSAPKIDNPLYKGLWSPKKIANPAYFNDKKPANFEGMGAVSHITRRERGFGLGLTVCRSVSNCGQCRTTSSSTTSTSGTPSPTPRPSATRPTSPSTRPRRQRKMPLSRRWMTLPRPSLQAI